MYYHGYSSAKIILIVIEKNLTAKPILHDIETNICIPNPCQHGVCLNNNSTFSCLCDDGWTGADCGTGKL